MTVKRFTDLCLALAVSPLAALLLLGLGGVLAVVQGRPVFYRAERMRSPDRSFRILKLRSMVCAPTMPQRIHGGDLSAEVTPLGRWLRRSRLDEVPQLWNVLRGDMSLVGPRPPLRSMVEAAPDAYAVVLQDRPGLTGLATVMICSREERLLAAARTVEEAGQIYYRRCLPVKLRIDRIYTRRKSPTLDLYILYLTLARIVRLPGRRAGRVWRDAHRAGPAGTAAARAAGPVRHEAEAGFMHVPAVQLSRNARLK